MMQIISISNQCPSGFFHLFQRKVEKFCIICLKLYSSAFHKHFFVSCEEFRRCQSTLRMSCLRPRIREVQEDLIHLCRCKHIFNLSCIHTDKTDILQHFKFFCIILFKCAEQNAGITLNSYKINLRMCLCHI